MSTDPDVLIERLIEERATTAEVALLESMLSCDPDLRGSYIRAIQLHAHLRRFGQKSSAAPLALPRPAKVKALRHKPSPRPRRFQRTAGLAAALLLSAAAVAIYVVSIVSRSAIDGPHPDGSPVATLIDATDTLIVNNDPGHAGSTYATGTYSIDSGSAELLLTSRVTVNLLGQTSLVMHDPMHATLTLGSATFECPPNAKGFTVFLPGGVKVVDLGTRFEVRLDNAGRASVRVIQGRVSVSAPGEWVQLTDAGTISIVGGRLGPITSGIPVTPITPIAPVTPVAPDIAQDIRPDLAVWYDFDGQALDRVGSKRPPDRRPSLPFGPGRLGQAAMFGASVTSQQVLVVPQADAFDPGVGSFSITFWVQRNDNKDDTTPADGILDALEGATRGYQVQFDIHGRMRVLLYHEPAQFEAATTEPFDDTTGFHHYAITVDRTPGAGHVRIYRDGVLDNVVPITDLDAHDSLSPSQDLWIGGVNLSRKGDRGFGLDGRLDDLRFYRGALSETDIRALADGSGDPTEQSTGKNSPHTGAEP